MPWYLHFVLDLLPRGGFWKSSKWPWNMIHSMLCRNNPCPLYIHLAFTYSISPSSIVSVKRTRTGSAFSTNESARKCSGHGPSVSSGVKVALACMVPAWHLAVPSHPWAKSKHVPEIRLYNLIQSSQMCMWICCVAMSLIWMLMFCNTIISWQLRNIKPWYKTFVLIIQLEKKLKLK